MTSAIDPAGPEVAGLTARRRIRTFASEPAEVTTERIGGPPDTAGRPHKGKLRFHPGDFFADPLPSADVLVTGHILHDWALRQRPTLLRKARQAPPDGRGHQVGPMLRARRSTCPACTSATHSQPGSADGPMRGSSGERPSRSARTYARSRSIRART